MAESTDATTEIPESKMVLKAWSWLKAGFNEAKDDVTENPRKLLWYFLGAACAALAIYLFGSNKKKGSEGVKNDE